MARLKNALRGHFIGVYDDENPKTEPTTYLELAKWISDIGDDTDEETDDTAFYDGDGTKETTVIGVSGKYTFEGTYDRTDPAMKFVADMKYKLGDGRKVWHKVVSADKTTQWVGVATATGIKAGSGAASDYEAFNLTLTFGQIPVETAVTP